MVVAAATTRAIRRTASSGTEDVSPFLFKRLSDESLGSRLASGEAAAFDELYRRYVHRLAAYGSHLLGDPAAGDDVAQSTLLKAYGALRDGRVPDKMRPWLFRIAHNTAIDLVVRRREFPADELPELASRDTEPLAGALVAALAALPERQRRVFVLRELHGMRIAEAALELGLASTQVEQALFAARNRLAELLVFGDRLDCATVQRLSAGPLDLEERRALKTHLRSCPACRKAAGLRGRALGWLPGPSLEWLRGVLVGGAAPAAAKVGAVVATATIAGSVPLAAQHPLPHPGAPAKANAHLRRAPVAHASLAAPPAARPLVFHAPAPVVSVQHATVAPRHEVREVEHHGSSSPETERVTTTEAVEPVSRESGHGGREGPAAVSDGPSTTTAETTETSGSDGGSSGSDGPGDGRSPAVTTVPAVAPPPPVPMTTTTSEDGGGSGGTSGSSGTSGDGGGD